MPDAPTIDAVLPCDNCGYNLRGLRSDHRCPECGVEIIRSVVAQPRALLPNKQDILVYHRRRHYAPMCAGTRYPADAFMFVHDAFRSTRAHGLGEWRPDGLRHVTARDVCLAVRAHAVGCFKSKQEAAEQLDGWGLRSSEDVGSIISAMVAAGFVSPSGDGVAEDFTGLFTLDTLFADRDEWPRPE